MKIDDVCNGYADYIAFGKTLIISSNINLMNINAMNMYRRNDMGSHDPPGIVRRKKAEGVRDRRIEKKKQIICFKELQRKNSISFDLFIHKLASVECIAEVVIVKGRRIQLEIAIERSAGIVYIAQKTAIYTHESLMH